MNRTIRSVAVILAAGALLVLLSSCPNPVQSVSLRDAIEGEVAVAVARNLKLTIETDSNAIVSPSGIVDAKEGIPVLLGATPFQTHALIGWTQTGGSGTVAFTQDADGVKATLSGGNATVAPLLVEKPKVLYSMPIGNNISRNSNIAVAFSSQIDFDSINQSTFQLLKSGVDQVKDGTYYVSADGKTVGFNPDSDLLMYTNYVISIDPDVVGQLDLDDYQQGNTIIIDQSLQIASSYTAAFRTGLDLDNIPPMNGAFSVSSLDGDLRYTGKSEVKLYDISADDDSGVALVLVKNPDDADYQSFSYQDNPSITWSIPYVDGPQEIHMLFEDWNNQRTPDLSKVVHSIYMDSTPPSGSITVDGYSGTVTEFVRTATVGLTLFASDPDVDTGVKGSGESTDGSNTVDRKMMRFGNSTSELSTADWETYATSKAGWALSGSTEGLRTVYAQFQDGVANSSPVYSDRIYLDVTAPAGSFQLNGGGVVTNSESVTLALALSDGSGSGVNTLKIKEGSDLAPGSAWSTGGGSSGTVQGDGSTASTFPYNASLAVVLAGGDGTKTVSLEATDRVGNAGTVSQTFTLDKTPPAGGSVVINGGALKTTSLNVTLTLTVPTDNLSGTTAMGFSNDESVPSAWAPVATSASWTLDSVDGDKTVRVWFRDAAGNYNATTANSSDTIILDTTPPFGSFTLSPNPTNSSAVTISSAVDGAALMQFSNNNSSWTGWMTYNATYDWDLVSRSGGSTANGTRTVYAQFRDDAGLTTYRSANVLYDSTAPSATVLVNAGAWATSGSIVTLTLSASDNIYASSSLQVSFSNNNVDYSPWEAFSTTKGWNLTSGYGGSTANQLKTVYVKVRDPLGNVTPGATASDSIYYDTVAPTYSGTLFVNSNTTYTNSGTVTLTLGSSDATSGLYQMRFSNNASSWSPWETYSTTRVGWSLTAVEYGGSTTEGTRYVYVQYVDRAGNISGIGYDGIVYDATPPSGTITIESGNPATSIYTYAYLYFSATDNLSGVTEMSLYNNFTGSWEPFEAYSTWKPWYLPPGNGTKYVYVRFKDGAGNIAPYVYDYVTLAETYGSLSADDIDHYGNSYMSVGSFTGNDPISSSTLAVGSVLVYFTNSGRYGKMEVTAFVPTGNILYFNFTTYESNGTVAASGANVYVSGTWSYDLDLGAMTSANADFWWSIYNSTTRSLVPKNGAVFFKWK